MVKKFNRCFKKVQIQGVVVLLDFVKSIAIKYAGKNFCFLIIFNKFKKFNLKIFVPC